MLGPHQISGPSLLRALGLGPPLFRNWSRPKLLPQESASVNVGTAHGPSMGVFVRLGEMSSGDLCIEDVSSAAWLPAF